MIHNVRRFTGKGKLLINLEGIIDQEGGDMNALWSMEDQLISSGGKRKGF